MFCLYLIGTPHATTDHGELVPEECRLVFLLPNGIRIVSKTICKSRTRLIGVGLVLCIYGKRHTPCIKALPLQHTTRVVLYLPVTMTILTYHWQLCFFSEDYHPYWLYKTPFKQISRNETSGQGVILEVKHAFGPWRAVSSQKEFFESYCPNEFWWFKYLWVLQI